MRLKLKGELISDEWAEVYRMFGFTAGFYCPGDVADAIARLQPGEELALEINSVGGMIDAASEIYSMIQACANPVRAEIQSLAASAASYFPLACDRVDISLPAQMMIHCVSWDVGGNKRDHRWAAEQLEVSDQSVLDVYCRKCGQKATRAQLQELMERESYLNARQCLEMGLVDGILGEEAGPEGEPLALVASITGNVVRAMSTLPDIRELIARRDSEQWKDQARLDLEKKRYERVKPWKEHEK